LDDQSAILGAGEMIWQDEPPTTGGHYWFVGLPYYSPVMVKVFIGVRSAIGENGKRNFWQEANADFPELGVRIWQGDSWPQGQWAGPMELPIDPHREVINPSHARRPKP
jgi:hypothetical protein